MSSEMRQTMTTHTVGFQLYEVLRINRLIETDKYLTLGDNRMGRCLILSNGQKISEWVDGKVLYSGIVVLVVQYHKYTWYHTIIYN